MIDQVGHVFRVTAARDVLGLATISRVLAQAARNEARIAQLARSNREIEALCDEVDERGVRSTSMNTFG